MNALPGPAIRKLKRLAQKLDPLVTVGKHGLSDQLITELNAELARHELVKVRFVAFKEEKKTLSPKLAQATNSAIVSRVGNVVVLFRRNPEPDKQKIDLPI